MLGKTADIFEKLSGIGHMMPGYKMTDEGGEKTLWDFPTQEEINEQDTPFLHASFALHRKFKVCGLPHGRGFLNERSTVVDIISIIEGEENRYESWQFKNRDHVEE